MVPEYPAARLALEAAAIRIAVSTLTSTDVAALEGCMAQMDYYRKVGDQAGLRGPHRAFHQTLVAVAGPRVSAEIAELTDHADRYRLRFGALGSWDDRRAEHRTILDAATSGDTNLATTASPNSTCKPCNSFSTSSSATMISVDHAPPSEPSRRAPELP